MIIPKDEIHIYQSSLDLPLKKVKEFENLLSADELHKSRRFVFEKDRINYISGRGLLRTLLGKYLSEPPSKVNFTYSDKGKPFIDGYTIKFNLAHSGGKAVYAFNSEHELGIDIEIVREMKDGFEIAERFFSQAEIEDLKTIDKDQFNEAFFNCWTRKEAFIKAIGDGLSYPLAHFSVSLKPADEPKIKWIKNKSYDDEKWSLYVIDTDENYISSLAVKSNVITIINEIIDL